MRREDRAAALACLDQPAILRRLWRARGSGASATARRDHCCTRFPRSADRTWIQTWATATSDSAPSRPDLTAYSTHDDYRR